jgi:hypothetical protein
MTNSVQTELANDSTINLFNIINRHHHCDWGDLCHEDEQANVEALKTGARLFSSYKLNPNLTLWVITEAEPRNFTTIMLPSDY